RSRTRAPNAHLGGWRLAKNEIHFIPRSPFRARSLHLPTEGRNPLGTMLDEMRGEAIRGIDMIKHHDVDIADRERAVNDHERIVEVGSGEVGKGWSCRRANHPCDMFIPQQVEGDRFLLRIVIRVAQEDAEPLLIGDIFDGSDDQGKERVANGGYDQAKGMGWLGA